MENMNKDIIFQSTYENIKTFMEGKDTSELVNLYLYIMGTESLERPPSKMEREFIKEFFTDDGWADLIQERKREQAGLKREYFIKQYPFNLDQISGILGFEVMKKIGNDFSELASLKKYKERKQKERQQLKQDLKTAINDSYEDGIFYKDDGWCNVADVLERNKLITLTED